MANCCSRRNWQFTGSFLDQPQVGDEVLRFTDLDFGEVRVQWVQEVIVLGRNDCTRDCQHGSLALFRPGSTNGLKLRAGAAFPPILWEFFGPDSVYL